MLPIQAISRCCGALALLTPLFLVSPVSAEEPATAIDGFVTHTSSILAIAYSPNGQYLAVGGGDYDPRSKKAGELVLWDTKTKEKAATLKGHTGAVRAVAFSPDGKRLASAGEDRVVRIWDTATFKELAALKGTAKFWRLAFSPDGGVIAGSDFPTKEDVLDATASGTVFLWDAKTFEVRAKLTDHPGPVMAIAFSPDGKTIAAASGAFDKVKDRYTRGEVKLWEVATGKLSATLQGHGEMIYVVAFSPDGKMLATGTSSWRKKDRRDQRGEIKLWDVANKRANVTVNVHDGTLVRSLAFSPDGKVLASGSWLFEVPDEKSLVSGIQFKGEVVLLDGRDLKKIATLSGYSGTVETLAFNPVNGILASSDYEKMKFWKLAERR